MTDDVGLGEELQQLRHAWGIAKGVAVLKGQLEGRALEVAEEDVQVIRIQQGVFRALAKEIIRVADDILVDRGGRGHIKYDAGALAAASAAGLLPGRSNGARVAAQHTGVQRADVDAEFQGVGGDDRVYIAGSQALFDLAALCGEVSAAIAAHPARVAQRIAHQVLQVLRQHLHRQTGTGEGDGLNAVFQ